VVGGSVRPAARRLSEGLRTEHEGGLRGPPAAGSGAETMAGGPVALDEEGVVRSG
jgi:hypothetical protein